MNKPKFKVGDRVRVIRIQGKSHDDLKAREMIGHEGEITTTEPGSVYRYHVSGCPDTTSYFKAIELEKVE